MNAADAEATLRKLAHQFREALTACPKEQFPRWVEKALREFPRQSCDAASSLLARHLRDRGYQDIQERFGYVRDHESHAWLDVGGWSVDITADQFPGVEPIIVARSDDPTSWHWNLNGHLRDAYGANPAAREAYDSAYAIIQSLLDTARTSEPEALPD